MPLANNRFETADHLRPYHDLALRALACSEWEHMEGTIIYAATSTGYRLAPNLEKPATLGCLLALIRRTYPEAWVGPGAGYRGEWAVRSSVKGPSPLSSPPAAEGWGPLPNVIGRGATEQEALVVALEYCSRPYGVYSGSSYGGPGLLVNTGYGQLLFTGTRRACLNWMQARLEDAFNAGGSSGSMQIKPISEEK